MIFTAIAPIHRWPIWIGLALVTTLWLPHGARAQASDPEPEAATGLRTGLQLSENHENAIGEGLFLSYQNVDRLSLVGALRSSITAVFESYCALNNLLPDDSGYDAWTLTLGLGCLAGATTLYYLTGQRISAFVSRSEAHARWLRYEDAKRDGLDPDEVEVFERELEDAADDNVVTRWISFGLGIASFVTAGVLYTLSASGDLDPAAGVSIGTGAVIVGSLSLLGFLIEGPDEQAWDHYLSVRPQAQ